MTNLEQELRNVLVDVNRQVESIKENMPGVNLYKLQDAQGNYILVPLLVAKAQALAGLANLKGQT